MRHHSPPTCPEPRQGAGCREPGCGLLAQLKSYVFTSFHAWLYAEIATHTFSHVQLLAGSVNITDEVQKQRLYLNVTCGIPLEHMRSFRAPYLVGCPPIVFKQGSLGGPRGWRGVWCWMRAPPPPPPPPPPRPQFTTPTTRPCVLEYTCCSCTTPGFDRCFQTWA